MKDENCIFCKLANGDIPTEAIYEDELVKVIFDVGPATKGHALILAKNHAANIFELDEDTAKRVFVVAKKVATAMKETFKCDGVNILQNNGEIAGQTVFHFHTHVIPRYENDGVAIEWEPGKVSPEEILEMKKQLINSCKL
ncbi:MAG: HIT family protein [Lachnospiraceae bacterium]|nr:HIT family protein [Lachnospira sp.]MBR6697262.1 HIT family protein [Lachnospiraceae bacterium]